MRATVLLLVVFIMSLPVMAENYSVNPWAYRNDVMQGQGQGRRPWGEMPANKKPGSTPAYPYQGYPYMNYRGYPYPQYYRPGYGYPAYSYGQSNVFPFDFPGYPGGGYLPGAPGFSHPGMGW